MSSNTRLWGARSAGPRVKLTSLHLSQPELDEAAINVIAWSHWEGRNNDVSLKTPQGKSGVRALDACMTGEAVRRSSHCATSSSLILAWEVDPSIALYTSQSQVAFSHVHVLTLTQCRFIAGLLCDAGHPANTRRWRNAGLMLAHRLRRWPNINLALGQRLVFAGQTRAPVSVRNLAVII